MIFNICLFSESTCVFSNHGLSIWSKIIAEFCLDEAARLFLYRSNCDSCLLLASMFSCCGTTVDDRKKPMNVETTGIIQIKSCIAKNLCAVILRRHIQKFIFVRLPPGLSKNIFSSSSPLLSLLHAASPMTRILFRYADRALINLQ